jgi:glycosyltransferase AglI
MEALRSQTIPGDQFEVIWIDDASRDGGGVWLREHLPPAWHLLQFAESRGSYAARNAGVEAAASENLAFTDVDCRPHSDWLEKGLAGLTVAPRVAGQVHLLLSNSPSIAELVDADRFLRQRRNAHDGFAATANLFVRRATFDAVGGFDGSLRSGGDQEFGWRCSQAGVPIHYAERAVVSHAARKSVLDLLRKSRRVGFGIGQVLRRGRMPLGTLAGRALERSSVAVRPRAEGRTFRHPGLRRWCLVIGVHALVVLASVAGGLKGALISGAPPLGEPFRPRSKETA